MKNSIMAALQPNELRALLLTHNNAALAQKLGVSYGTIRRWRRRYAPGTMLGPRVAPRRQQVLKILSQYPNGLRVCELLRLLPATYTRSAIYECLCAARSWGEVVYNRHYPGAPRLWLVTQLTIEEVARHGH